MRLSALTIAAVLALSQFAAAADHGQISHQGLSQGELTYIPLIYPPNAVNISSLRMIS